MPLDKKFFLISMSLLAFAANIVTLYSFFAESTFQATWTFQWIMSIIFIALMFFAGMGFIIAALDDDEVTNYILLIYSFVYGIASTVFYFYWGIEHAKSILSVGQYIGYLLLYAITISASIFGITNVDDKYLRFISYLMGISNIAYLFVLIDKYVFKSGLFIYIGFELKIKYIDCSFHYYPFLGEISILIAGALLFLALVFHDDL